MKLTKSLYLIMAVLLMGMLVTACDESVDLSETEVVETEEILVVETVEIEEEAVEVPDPDLSDDPAGSDPAEGSSDVLPDGWVVACVDGALVSDQPWGPTEFDLGVTDTTAIFTANHQELSNDGIFFTGVDFQVPAGPQTGPIPGFALGEGMTFGVSAAFQGDSIQDITAARAGDNGELLPWTTAATAEIEDRIVTIEVPLSEIPGGIEMIRFTFSDGEICELSASFEIDNGYVRPSAMRSPTLEAYNVDFEQEKICYPDVCFNLPAGAGWTPTGENTGNVTIGGFEFILQVYTTADGADNIVKIFEDTGWNPGESGAFKSPLGPFLVYDLESSNEVYGSLGVLETRGGENPQTAVVAATGQNPLSEAVQESVSSFMNQVMDSVRPGL